MDIYNYELLNSSFLILILKIKNIYIYKIRNLNNYMKDINKL